MMAVISYHDLESSMFNQMRLKTLTRIHGTPNWHQVENMTQECEGIVIDCQTSYIMVISIHYLVLLQTSYLLLGL